MKLFKYFFLICTAVFLLAGAVIFYAFHIEPGRVRINTVSLSKASAAAGQIKILQFSDLHIKKDFTLKNLDKVVNKINAQKPDVIIFTGDLYDNYALYHDNDGVIGALQKIEARHGKFAIWGNRDYGGGAVRKYEAIMKAAGFTVLKNESLSVTLKNSKKLLLTGIDDALLGDPRMPAAETAEPGAYKILLTHEPDAMEHYEPQAYDLILSGHSHGGQINLPFLPMVNQKALAATDLAAKYSRGMSILENGSRLYVNTGIGTTHISARLGVVPEIAVFNIAF